jgi:hypothetical protein
MVEQVCPAAYWSSGPNTTTHLSAQDMIATQETALAPWRPPAVRGASGATRCPTSETDGRLKTRTAHHCSDPKCDISNYDA